MFYDIKYSLILNSIYLLLIEIYPIFEYANFVGHNMSQRYFPSISRVPTL